MVYCVPESEAKRAAVLDAVPLFAKLTQAEKKQLSRRGAFRTYQDGEVIFLQHTPADGFYVVVSGQVKVYLLGNDGREQVLHVLDKGQTVGEAAVFEGTAYPAASVAVGETCVLHILRERFVKLGAKRPQMYMEMLAVLSRRLRGFVHLVDDLALKEVSARLAKRLLDMGVQQGVDTVTLDSTKTVLASRLGTVAETLSRCFARMQRRKMIRVAGKQIVLYDREALLRLAAGEKL